MRPHNATSIPFCSPVRLFFTVLAVAFLAEIIAEEVVGFIAESFLLSSADRFAVSIVNVVALSCLIASLVGFFAVAPLHRIAVEQGCAATVVSSVGEGIITINGQGLVESFNPAAERIFGYGAAEVVGNPLTLFFPERYREFLCKTLEEVCTRGKPDLPGKPLEFQAIRKYGNEFPVELSLTTWRVRKESYCTGIVRDVTERKRAEDALASRTRQLEAVWAITAEITRELELARLLELITCRAADLVGGQTGTISLWDVETKLLIPYTWHGLGEWRKQILLRLGEGVAGTALARREGLLVNDYRSSSYALPQFLAHSSVAAVLAEPLLYRDRLVGVITITRSDPERPFTVEDQRTLSLLATHAAIAIENARLHSTAMRRGEELQALLRATGSIIAGLDLEDTLDRIVHEAAQISGAPHVKVVLVDKAAGLLQVAAAVGRSRALIEQLRLPLHGSLSGLVAVTGKLLYVPNCHEDPRNPAGEEDRALGIQTYLGLPIKKQDEVLGVLTFNTLALHEYSSDELAYFTAFADQAALALENARLFEQEQQRRRQLATLTNLTRVLTTELDPQTVTRRILEAVQVLIPNTAGHLIEQMEGSESWHVVASVGLEESAIEAGFHLDAGKELVGIAIATGQPVASTDLASDPRSVNKAWAVSEGLVSGIVLPFVYGDRVIGVLSVYLRRRHVFTDEEVDLLKALAAHGAIALANARLFAQVRTGRERLIHLTQQVVSAQEEERGRLARELHDEAGQALTALRISLGLIREDLPGETASLRHRLTDAATMAESITDQLRFLAQALRPPALDAMGLDVALKGLCRDFSRHTGLPVEYAGENLPPVPGTITIHLYRFVQEALTNVSRHARARRARVALGYEGGTISLLVEDDGVGFDATGSLGATRRPGLGLIGMRERLDLLKGRLEIASQPGQGTRLAAWVPWPEAA